MPSLSVCLIVKNEERVLPRCLRSVQELADEIVVVDTGSSDGTVEIAQAHGARVFHYQWHDDFAAARNYAMDQATGDWVLQIDADEEFYRPDLTHLREIIQRDDIDGVHLVLRNFFPSPATQTDESLPDPKNYPHSVNHFPRLVRNRPHIRYSGAIHEGFRELDHVLVSDVSIFHYGYAQEDERKNRRFERNREMTLKNVEANPDDPIARYYAATTCLSSNLHDEAERHFLDMIRLAEPEHPRQKHFYQMANFHLATLATLSGDREAEERFAREALKHDPEYLDPWLRLGEACFFLEKYWESERAFRRYLEVLQELTESVRTTKYTLYLTEEAHYAWFFLGRLAQLREDFQSARECYEKAITLRDSVWGPHYFLGLLYEEKGDPRAEYHLSRAADLNPELRGAEGEGRAREFGSVGAGPERSRRVPEAGTEKDEGAGDQEPPQSSILHREAHDLVRRNQLELAREKLSEALRLEPESAGIRSDLGWVLFQLGQQDAAERLWLEALDRDPANAVARRNLADCYYETRRLDLARTHYETLVSQLGGQADAQLLDGLADVHAEQGNAAEALRLYERVLELTPSATAIREKIRRLSGV